MTAGNAVRVMFSTLDDEEEWNWGWLSLSQLALDAWHTSIDAQHNQQSGTRALRSDDAATGIPEGVAVAASERF